MISRRALLVVAILAAACGSPPSPTTAPVVIHSGENTLSTLPGGSYTVAWTSDCSALELEWAPTSGGASVPITVANPRAGSVVIGIPGGEAYLNGAGSCPTGWTVTITPAAGPS